MLNPSLPALTVNRSFIRDFIAADTPCFALGIVEEHNRHYGFLTLRPLEPIPPEVLNVGFNFGHSLLGNDTFEVIHFAFEFYGFLTYNVLVNPNNPLVQTVLNIMVEQGDYFFFTLDSNSGATTAFRAEIGLEPIMHLKENLPRILSSTTTDSQYQQALSHFALNPYPEGKLLEWVCRDNIDYLDLTKDRLDLTPA
ncbi:MAG: hypothetical protein WA919_03500 [Coleofasciculaceae cyanobacterium]